MEGKRVLKQRAAGGARRGAVGYDEAQWGKIRHNKV